jgi:hypothetical protein
VLKVEVEEKGTICCIIDGRFNMACNRMLKYRIAHLKEKFIVVGALLEDTFSVETK